MRKAGTAALLALAAALAACSENTVAPRSTTSSEPASVQGGGSTASLTSWDTLRFSITIDPSRQTNYYLGAGNSIVFPAHSLCNPWKSSYGEGEWDKPCVLATSPLTISVKAWINHHGHPQLDFSPSVRFVPSNNPAQWVVLSFGDYRASLDPMFNILYCPRPESACHDESKRDPSLATMRNPVTGQVTRRVKHFSGYNVAAGDSRDGDDSYYDLGANSMDSVHGTLAQVSTSSVFPKRSEVKTLLHRAVFVRRHSGYVLASG